MPVVKTALVIARDEQGQNVYLYEGAQVPASIPSEEVERLADYLTFPDEKAVKAAPKSDK